MKLTAKKKTFVRTALVLFAGLLAYCAPLNVNASDSCYRTANLPTPTASISNSSYVYITWDALSASCYAYYNPRYVVYRSTSSTFSWSSVSRLTTTTNRYYYDYTAAVGTTYYYWIGVVDESDNSVWVTQSKKDWGKRVGDCIQTLDNPQPSASVSYPDYVYLSWSSFGTCSSFSGIYVVYRSTSSTFSWSSVSKLAETRNLYYYDYSAAVCGTTYYYWIGVKDTSGKIYVQASRKDWAKRTGCNDCMQTLANPQPSASDSYTDYVYLSWSSFGTCSAFSGTYVVYRSTSSTFSWSSVSKLTETRNLYYYDRSASVGTTYYYWIGVKDNSGKIYVQDSKKDWGKREACMTTMSNPQPSVSISSPDYVYLSWSSFGTCSSFSGTYVVYRSTSSTFSWSSVSKLTETRNLYYYDYSASSNTTYYYWIGVKDTSGKIYVQTNKSGSVKRRRNCMETLDNPQPFASTSYSSYVYVSWSSFGTCSAFSGTYVVYRSTSSTFSWSSVSKLVETRNLYYYDYLASANTTYYYWIGVKDNSGKIYVQAAKKDWGKRTVCMATVDNPQPSASKSYSNYIYISWSSFGTCSSFNGIYVVYRSTLSTFSWSSVSKLVETRNLYYYDYSAAYGTTYYYWIGVKDTSGKIYVQSSKSDWGRRSY